MKILFLHSGEIDQTLAYWLTYQAHETVYPSTEKLSVDVVENLRPDLLVSYNYRHILHEDILHILARDAINLHISLLPWNRGAHPNVWSFLEETPKGVTIHRIDNGIDTGDILLQQEISFDEAHETLASSYQKLHQAIQQLFKVHWDDLKHDRLPACKQPEIGTKHYAKEFEAIMPLFGERIWDMPICLLKQQYHELCNSEQKQ